MKKNITIALILILILSLTACNDNEDHTKKEAEKNIEKIALKLELDGYGDPPQYPLRGAVTAKVYEAGDLSSVEFYYWDPDSEEYEEIEETGMLDGAEISTYRNGYCMFFPNAIDYNLIEDYNEMDFSFLEE